MLLSPRWGKMEGKQTGVFTVSVVAHSYIPQSCGLHQDNSVGILCIGMYCGKIGVSMCMCWERGDTACVEMHKKDEMAVLVKNYHPMEI